MNTDYNQDFNQDSGLSHPEIGSLQMRRQLGEEIKKAREAKELTLEQLQQITKINVKLLVDIEEGRWKFLSPVYIKMFIITIAEAVDLTNDTFHKSLHNMFRATVSDGLGKDSAISGDDFTNDEDGGSGAHSKSLAPKTIALIVVSVIVVGVVALWLFGPSDKVTDDVATQVLPKSTTAQPATATIPPPIKAPVVPADTVAAKTGENFARTMSLSIVAKEASNVSIDHQGVTIYDQMLYSGQSMDEKMPYPISVTVSNPGGLKLTWDGKTQDIGKGKKQVSFTLTTP